ncbi:pecanex-like protein 4 [Panulirus ornatus]|uniref:pecanex-like protein 4 n=1 Tax=Panulirus ornatus TaxID=150431 RepID=UPI003A83D321
MNEYSATARLAWAAAHRRMESPLVNDYKKPFIIRRLVETFLGGLRLFASEDAPFYVYVLQIIVFSVIPLLTILFVTLEHNGMITLSQAVFASAVLAFLYSLAVHLVAYFLRTQKSKTGEIEQVNLASDEEVLQFDSPLGPKTWAFLIREKKLKGGIIINSLLVGVLGGGIVYYVRPSTTYHLNVPWDVSLSFTILGIFTAGVGVWPLIGGSPPEPATFHPLSWDLSALSRPSHMLTCVLVHLISDYYPEVPWLLPLDGFCHMVFAVCSVLWLLGILPPIDAYLLWLLEQWLVVVLGGSPMSSTPRLIGQVIIGTLTLFMAAAMPSFAALMIFAACRGFVLSVDSAWMFSSLLSHKVTLLTGLSGKYEETRPLSGKPSLRRITCQRELALFVPMLVAVASMSFGSQLPHLRWYEQVINITRDDNATMTEIPRRPALFQIWQFPQASFLQLSVYFVVELIRRKSDLSMETWRSMSPATRIFLLSLSHLWGTRLIHRLSTILLFIMTPFTEKKQKNFISFFLLGFNIAISPILVGIVIVSTVISAPLLPLFTLPIFLMGFPRPMRFWSYPVGRSSNSCDDSVYYEQLTPHVVFALHNLLQTGSLGITEPGEHFLLRWEDRFMWVQILECGFTYQYYSVKGLELQETSCHTAEASRVDANFSRAFDEDINNKEILSSLFNPHAFHTLTPLTKFTVLGYSDTRNVLTGVIDSPDTLSIVRDYFHKALLYVVMDYIVNRSAKFSDIKPEEESKTVLKGSSKNRSQEHLRSLPKIARRTEYDFEEGVPQNKMELDSHETEQPYSFDRRISHASQQSQSGRGSRVAWVDGQRSIPVVPTGDTPPPPSNWIDEDDPLDDSDRETLNIKNKSEKSQPSLRSKVQDYMSSLEDIRETDKQVNFIPGLMYDSSDDDERISMRSKAMHHGFRQKSSAKVNLRMISQPELRSPIYESPISAALAPLPNWIVELPFDAEVIDEVQDTFPHAWFKFLLNTFGHYYVECLDQSNTPSSKASCSSKTSDRSSGKGGDREAYIQRMQYDETLEESYRFLTGTCHLIILGMDNLPPSPTQVYKTFIGEVSWSMALDWLINKQILYELVLQAYRIGVKLALDHTLIGGITGWAELQSTIEDYTRNWYFGPDARVNDPNAHSRSHLSPDSQDSKAMNYKENKWPQSWIEAVRMETANLFSLGYNAVKGVHTSHLLTLGEAEIAVGRLGSETVRGLWASLVAELLYLTNDDDERYSIQAQPGLLRNLTIQAADPPLGYPIFSSPPLRLAVAWLSATFEQVHLAEQK